MTWELAASGRGLAESLAAAKSVSVYLPEAEANVKWKWGEVVEVSHLCVQDDVVLQASMARAQHPNEVDMAGK